MPYPVTKLVLRIRDLDDARAGAEFLLNKVIAWGRESAHDPARLGQLLDDLERSRNDLADAVVANTPADPRAAQERDDGGELGYEDEHGPGGAAGEHDQAGETPAQPAGQPAAPPRLTGPASQRATGPTPQPPRGSAPPRGRR